MVNNLTACLISSKPTFDYQIDSFYGFFRDILTVKDKKQHDDEMISLYSKILQDKYINYTDFIDYLKTHNIITVDERYSEGHSRRYGFVKSIDLKSSPVIIEINRDSNFWTYVRNRHNKEQKRAKHQKKHIVALRNKFYDKRIDVDSAIADIDSNKIHLTDYQYSSIIKSIHSLDSKNLMCRKFTRKIDKSGRVFTNLTSLKSHLKKYIISDEEMYVIDLSNCQPVLFNIILNTLLEFIDNKNMYTYTLSYEDKDVISTVKPIYLQFKTNSKWVGKLKKEIEEYSNHTSTV